jgi:hypothetical protein
VPALNLIVNVTIDGTSTQVSIRSAARKLAIEIVEPAAREAARVLGKSYNENMIDRVTFHTAPGPISYGAGETLSCNDLKSTFAPSAPTSLDITMTTRPASGSLPSTGTQSSSIFDTALRPGMRVVTSGIMVPVGGPSLQSGLFLNAESHDAVIRPGFMAPMMMQPGFAGMMPFPGAGMGLPITPLLPGSSIHASPIQGTVAIDVGNGIRSIVPLNNDGLLAATSSLPLVAPRPGLGVIDVYKHSNLVDPKRGNVWTPQFAM